ncbi:MAG: D-glycero-beta-D-manno-heptose 1,7-bisphosphate 7-phosphatase [Planctomycetota bacterium]|jgi:D-glycero-D-manno-heptose 1,7-bisphosphate phosphatase
MPRPAVFLDRDGVIIEEKDYLSEPSQVSLLSGAAKAIARVNSATIPVVVITNQSGVARGFFPESRIPEIHARLDALLAEQGARIDAYYYCPHHPTKGDLPYLKKCDCRKPEPGLLYMAAEELDLDLEQSFMIGDKPSDLQAGARAGCRSILVKTGYGGQHAKDALESKKWNVKLVAEDLAQAIEYVLKELKA